jgi:2-amino-4-hydroxy-6-hydroxymethyldihydropteridine diphosphokinase
VTEAVIGLGSNVGDRLAWIRKGVEALRASEVADIVRVSSVFETAPIGPPQPDFLNAAVLISTEVSAPQLLDELKKIETTLGRSRGDRWGPREIDLDLLLFGDESIEGGVLQVPHPRLLSRAFALIPLLEVFPDAALPDGTRLDTIEIDSGGVSHFATLET